LIFISILINNLTKKLRKKNLIQNGKIIYSDLNKPEKSLFSKKYRLIGKPDYIVKRNGYFIPVEVKSGKHNTVKKSHIYQLIAYCQLIEDNYNIFTPYGIIIYPETSKQFEIQFDPKRRFQLDSIIKEMRKSISANSIMRNHNEKNRCIKCSMRQHCNKKII
jgi:CRISPR-associated protein Cas4